MKSTLCFLVKSLFFLLSCILLSLLWPLYLIFCREGIANRIYALSLYYLFKYSAFAKIKYLNLEKLESHKNFIYIFNHQSFFDTVMMGFLFPENAYIIAKDSLKYIPFFGLLYYLSGNFYIKRGDSEQSKKILARVVEKIKLQKSSIFILPQGTRSYDNSITKFKRGFIHIAKATETPILLCVISSYKLKDLLFGFRNNKPIYVKICETIDYKKLDDEILLEVKILMIKNIRELDALA